MDIQLNISQAISYLIFNANFISVMGFTLLEWALASVALSVSAVVVRYMISYIRGVFGVPVVVDIDMERD